MRRTSIFIFMLVSVFAFSQTKQQASALEIESRILDHANLLTAQQKQNIFDLIKDLEKKVGSQIAIVTIESLNGQTINSYSITLANQLHLGRKKYKDGILILFAVNDGQLRMEVGVGLDKIITNEISSLINEAVIAPQFRVRNYAGGFYNGVKAIKERIEADKNLVGKQP